MANVVCLEGRVGNDLEVKKTKNDKSFLSFIIFVPTNKKDEENNVISDMIPCKAAGPTAEFIEKYFTKGKPIFIQGNLNRDDDYTDKDGVEHKGSLSVFVTNVSFVIPDNTNESGNTHSTQDKKVGKSKPSLFNTKTSGKTSSKGNSKLLFKK